MNKAKWAAAAVLVLIIAAVIVLDAWSGKMIKNSTTTMILTSPSFEANAEIPKKFTCDGGDINPELQIQNVPAEAKSLALIVHDPDAPVAHGFTHWVVWNISPATMVIKEESTPPGSMEGRNGAGSNGYIGPCPPSGTHHYHFMLYALDTMLVIPASSTKADLEAAIAEHTLAKTELIGLYSKQ